MSPRSARLPWVACTLAALALAFSPMGEVQAQDGAESPEQLYRSGRYEESIDAAAELLDQNDRREPYWIVKLKAELAVGQYEDAAKTYEAGVTRIPYSVQLRWLGREALRYAGRADEADALDNQIALLLQRSPWQFSDAPNQVMVGQWLLEQGADPKQVLTKIFNEVKRNEPKYVDVWLAIGEMALDKHDYQLAGEAYQQAVKLDPESAAAHFGVAQAFAPSNSEKADAALKTALEKNPRLTDALLMVVDAHVDAERYIAADEMLNKVDEINPQHPLAHAYRAVLAHLRNKLDKEKEERELALKLWPDNPEVDHLIGLKLSQKYRFKEGAMYQRRAIVCDPEYLPARAQLAQDLMRLGQEEEGIKLAAAVHEEDAYDVFAFNLVTLQESLSKFRTIEDDGLLVRMDAAEAEIYGPRVMRLLKRAKETLTKKYSVELDTPIIVELFPRQQDFAIRTFGMPGGAGFLGVCFGTVVTAPSPGSPGALSSCWESTLWHEFCHVVTLSKTNNKMPRWLSEGVSVYEERQADPTWGEQMTPQYRQMILGEDLTPVSQLSGAFLSPKSGLHLQFAYYESSLVVEYLLKEYGQGEFDRVLNDLGAGLAINEALGRVTGQIEELDAKFAEYARQKAESFAPDADWTAPDLEPRAEPAAVAAWVKEHPTNYIGLSRLAQQQIVAKQWAEAEQTLLTMKRLCPHDTNADNPYTLLARIYREKGDAEAELAVLHELALLSSDDAPAFERLGELAVAAGDWESAKKWVVKSLAVNPMLPAVQRRAAETAEKLADWGWVIESCTALARLTPFDAAEIHYRLAVALGQQGQAAEAKRHTLLALEETPRYRAAQELLLQLVKQAEGAQATEPGPASDESESSKPPAPAPEATSPDTPTTEAKSADAPKVNP